LAVEEQEILRETGRSLGTALASTPYEFNIRSQRAFLAASRKWVTCPRKTRPEEVGNFGLRGSVCARAACIIAVNVTQVTVSSKSLETGA
jgi:hypothetical protein